MEDEGTNKQLGQTDNNQSQTNGPLSQQQQDGDKQSQDMTERRPDQTSNEEKESDKQNERMENDEADAKEKQVEEIDDRTESEISSDEQGCVTKCYTVYKLEPQTTKKPVISKSKNRTAGNGNDASIVTPIEDKKSGKNASEATKKAGIY